MRSQLSQDMDSKDKTLMASQKQNNQKTFHKNKKSRNTDHYAKCAQNKKK